MRLISWNINGLRSLRSDYQKYFDKFNAQIICFQETKLSRNLVEDWMAFVPNYSSYFSFPKYKTGYSGVVTYCDQTVCPVGVEDCLLDWNEIITDITETDISFESNLRNDFNEKLDLKQLKLVDSEGRVIITKHLIEIEDSFINLFIFNVYCPRADPQRPDRLEFKINFYKLLERKSRHLMGISDNNYVIIMGDINTSHKRIDNCDPSDDFESNAGRDWLTNLLGNSSESQSEPQFIDVFRYLYPNRSESYTCWNTQLGARLTNFGTRIDYIIADSRLKNCIKDCIILDDILGSDHCPVLIEFNNIKPTPSAKYSKLCTKLWPEFGNTRQSTLTSFLNKTKNRFNENQMHSEVNVKKLKITARQTKLSDFYLIKDNKTAQCVNSDISQLECDISIKKSNELLNISENSNISVHQSNDQIITHTNQDSSDTNTTAHEWKLLFKAIPKPPNCSTHCEPCIVRKVSKPGPNYGKQFFVCNRPVGHQNNPKSKCNFFKWAKDVKHS